MKTAREYADWFLEDLCHLEPCQIDTEMLVGTIETVIRDVRADGVSGTPSQWVDEAPLHLSSRASGESRLLIGPVVLIVTLTHKGRCYADAGALVVMEWLQATNLADAKIEAVALVRERLTAMLAALPVEEEAKTASAG